MMAVGIIVAAVIVVAGLALFGYSILRAAALADEAAARWKREDGAT